MIEELNALYPAAESKIIVDWLWQAVTGMEKHRLVIEANLEIDAAIEHRLMVKFSELLTYRPIQYVTGQAFFFGLELAVDESVLIPRPETEELVSWVLHDHKDKSGLKILDACTGSGCIAVALGNSMPGAKVEAFDVSAAALQLAGRNSAKHKVKTDLYEIDLLQPKQWEILAKYDVITCNPPYVRQSEKRDMKKHVTAYEPSLALFVPDEDPLLFYRSLAALAREKLTGSGHVYAEINQCLGGETRDLFLAHGFHEVILKKDFRGNDRMIRAAF